MKKAFALRLCIVIAISMLATALLSYCLQIKSAKAAEYENSVMRLNQIAQILEKNNKDLEQLKKNLEEDYFIRAKAAAYIIQKNPEVIGDLEEIRKIASLLQVDELHLFDKEGRLFGGTVPEYYDYTFSSGEQMQFFLPMLEDTTLELCQEVTPNTAESKLMQYLAVWREDGEGIIQIGMEPVRLLDAMAKNELSHIFTMVTTDNEDTIFAINLKTGEIAGTTNKELNGKKAEEIGIDLDKIDSLQNKGINIEIDGEKNYCVLMKACDVLIGVSTTYENIYKNIEYSMLLVIISLFVLSFIIIILILSLLDKYIIHGIYELISGMNIIASGDLDYRVETASSPELVELGSNINHMVKSLLETTGKLSLVFENVNIPIAVYEYNQDMKRVLATSKIGDILMLSGEEMKEILSDHIKFNKKIIQVYANPYTHEKDVYLIGDENIHYVKIKSYHEENKTLGIIVDVTDEIVEKQRIKRERDIDILTGIYSRRALFSKMDKLFARKEELKHAVLLMTDLDNLKYVNDKWGHEFGDIMLKTAADLLNGCEAPDKLAARLSGDEFILFIYNLSSEEEGQSYIDRLYENVLNTSVNICDKENVPVSLSGGYIFYPGVTSDYMEMLHFADQTMYKVKKSIKGSFKKYNRD